MTDYCVVGLLADGRVGCREVFRPEADQYAERYGSEPTAQLRAESYAELQRRAKNGYGRPAFESVTVEAREREIGFTTAHL